MQDPFILEFISQWIAWCAQQLNVISPYYLMAILVLPIVAALASRQINVLLGTILLAIVAIAAHLRPNEIAPVVVAGGFVGSFVLALAGLSNGRRHRAAQAQLRELQEELMRLRDVEQRRFLSDLRSRKPNEPSTPEPVRE